MERRKSSAVSGLSSVVGLGFNPSSEERLDATLGLNQEAELNLETAKELNQELEPEPGGESKEEELGANLLPPPLPAPRICLWKYLDVHSMDLLEKTTTLEEMQDTSLRSRPRLLVLCFRTSTRPALRPPFSIDLFGEEQLLSLSDYIVNTYFRHFKLYKYVFTPQVRLDLSLRYVGLPEVKPPADVQEEERVVETASPVLEKPAPEIKTEQEPSKESRDPGDILRDFISAQLTQELGQLRQLVEERLKAGEEQLNSRLVALENPTLVSKSKNKAKSPLEHLPK
ncbi:cilia- and flagella-associated protein 119 isoform X4 [Phascolarctos cinereus]|uniref:Coiled-coil domain-containing protein 189 isoform X6 n=1 Tax=Phascolarctos cinereus TaxID=38626 RepID=A0A6P5M706_PHACI|nr:coiled-coil domain-containing protein 189 isoform X6 [Phascolarctos cinereus]